MRIGISITRSYRVDDPREGARRMVARTRAARSAGLDSLFVGDHHATPWPYYQNSVILGRLLAEWGERPFGALYLLPLWHPVLLAEQIGTLASLAEGRFVMQCTIGPDDRQFPAMGVDPRQRPSRFEEALSLMKRLWTGEEVSAEGRWSFSRARISPVPSEPVEVWVGATAEVAIDRAARLGDGWIGTPGLLHDEATRLLDVYREACSRHGRHCEVRAIRRDVYVGESEREARATAGPVVDAGYRGFPEGATVVGDAPRVAATFAKLAEAGYTDVIVRNLIPDPVLAVASTERLSAVREQVAGL